MTGATTRQTANISSAGIESPLCPQGRLTTPAPDMAYDEELWMIDALFDLLGAFHEKGDFVQAERMAHRIMQAIPDDTVSLQFLGLIYYRSGRRDEAMQAFNSAARHSRHCSRVDGSLRASTQCLRAASSQGSALAGAWYELGLVLLRLRRFRQSMDALQSALSTRPDFPAAQRAIEHIRRLHFAKDMHRLISLPLPGETWRQARHRVRCSANQELVYGNCERWPSRCRCMTRASTGGRVRCYDCRDPECASPRLAECSALRRNGWRT